MKIRISANGRFFIICILYFSLFSIPLIWQPLHGDETFLGFFAKKNFGERFTGFFLGSNYPQSDFFNHPHLHYFVTRLFVSLNRSDSFVRLAGIFTNLLSITIFYGICEKILKNKKYLYIGLMLLVTNPFFIQSSLLVDLDNTVVAFALLLFSYTWLTLQDSDSFNFKKQDTWKLVLTIFLLYWSKFVVALVNLPSFVVYVFLKNRKKMPNIILFLFLGFLLFYLSWSFYASYYNGDYFQLLKFSMKASSSEMNSFNILAMGLDVIKKMLTFILWVNPILFLIFLYLLFKNKFLLNEKIFLIVLVIIFTLIMNFLVATLPGGFPKYWSSILPLIILVTALLLEKCQPLDFNRKDLFAGIFLGVIYFLSGNIFITLWKIKYWTVGIGGINIKDLLPVFFLTALFLFILLGVRKKRVISFAVVLVLTISTATNVQNLLQKEASNYNYGETGMLKVVNLVKQLQIKPKNIITREDIAYYSFGIERLGEYKHTLTWLEPKIKNDENIKELFKKEKIKLIVWRDMDYFSYSHIINNPKLKQALKSYNYRRIGNFQIWIKFPITN